VAQPAPITQPPASISFPEAQLRRDDEEGREYRVVFPSAFDSGFPTNDQVPLRLLMPSNRVERVPVVVILHYWGATDDNLERRFAAQLNRRGVAAALLALPYHLDRTPAGYRSGELAIQPDPAKLRAAVLQSVLDVRRSVDWLSTRSDLDTSRLGIVGTSLGAIVATAASAVDPRFTSAAFVLGGVDLAGILWNSSRVVAERETLRRLGFTEARLREALSDVEPAGLLKQHAPATSLVIAADYDTVVPPAATNQLIDLLHEPKTVRLRTGHFGGVFAEREITRTVGEFFQARFFGTQRSNLARTLSAPTIRLGFLVDGQDRLQVAAGVDVWRSNARADAFGSILLSPRGPRAYLGFRLAPGLSVGPMATSQRVTIGGFWSFVL
jgi:dienelactone hydrolase